MLPTNHREIPALHLTIASSPNALKEQIIDALNDMERILKDRQVFEVLCRK